MKRLNILLLPLIFLISCSEQHKEESKTKNIFYDKAFEYRERRKADSAFLYFNRAKDVFSQREDSLGIGKCLLNMAIISTDKSDYFGGQELSLNAMSYFDKSDKDQHVYIKSNFNNLGLATYKLKDYQNCLRFYDSAILFSHDSLDTRIYLNNKAKTYQVIKKYRESLKIYNQILKETSKNQVEYARVLTNISITKLLQNPKYNASSTLLEALRIREKEKDLWGQHSSYGHLADYYTDKSQDSALNYARKAYAIAKQINSPDDKLRALKKLIELSPSTETKQYFDSYQELDDSLQTVRSAAKNQFALIRYETEKNKADNLILQKDNEGKTYQIIILGFGIFLIVIVGSIWYKQRKQKLELKAQNTIRESQLKTSKKVHDVVANGLYRVMTEIENQNDIDREGILDKLENMYEKSRDISYEEIQFTDQNFDKKILSMLSSFVTETVKVVTVGNSPDLWKKVNTQVKYEVEHILQELMVNMKKHSDASNVALRFELKSDKINIYYVDNGIGISAETKFKNGLTNTGNRIDDIHREINFDTKFKKGLRIQISFPIS